MGHVVALADHEFTFSTRWHSARVVHVPDGAPVKCSGNTVPMTAIRLGDVVEIDALVGDDGIWASKLKLHVPARECAGRVSVR